MESNKEHKEANKKSNNRLFKWVRTMVLILILLPILLILLIQIPAVQSYVIKKTTGYLSEKMEAKVTIGSLDFSIFDGFKLRDFAILEMDGDTVIHARALNVALSKNLFSIFENRVAIKSIALDHPHIHLVKTATDRKINLLNMIGRLSNNDGSGGKSQFILDIKNIDITYLEFSLYDELNKNSTTATLEQGSFIFKTLDFQRQLYNVDKLLLQRPNVQIINFESEAKTGVATPSSNLLCIDIRELAIHDGKFVLHNNQHAPIAGYHFDSNHIDVNAINLNIGNLNFGGVSDMYAQVKNLGFQSGNGFELKKLSIPQLVINDQKISLEQFELITKESEIKDKIVLQYNHFDDLNQFYSKVLMDARFSNSKIALNEIAYFVPSFDQSGIYRNNQSLTIDLKGKLSGRLNNLRGSELLLEVGDRLHFEGDFGIRNVADGAEALANFRVKKLDTHINFLKEVIPGFDPPKNFYTLGQLNFIGNFDGYLNDFVAYGKLNTAIGHADLDMRLDVKQGNELAKYSGNIKLFDFDLHKWSGGDPNLGKVSLEAKIRDGESLILKSAKADLIASIDLLQFKNYNYRDIKLNGKISPKEFLGNLESKDPNIDLNFDGSILFSEALPKFNFKSTINNISPDKLNLLKDFKTIKGEITFDGEGNDVNNLLGKMTGKQIVIVKNDTSYHFDHLTLESKNIDKIGNKQLVFDSDHIDLFIEGKYNFNTLVDDVKALVKNNFPYHTRQWQPSIKPLTEDQKFKFDIELNKPQDVFALIGIKNVGLNIFKGKGFIDSKNKEISFASNAPSLVLGATKLLNIQVLLNNKSAIGDLLIHVDSIYSGNTKISPIDLSLLMNGDKVNFSVESKNFMDSIQNISIKGIAIPHEKGYTIGVSNNDLRFFGKRWKINNESKVSLGNKYIDLQNFIVTDGERQLELTDINNRGLTLKANKLAINSINPFLNYPKILFGGELNTSIRVNDVFNASPSLTGSINIPALYLNNDSYGEVTIDLAKAENRPLEALISISNKENGQAVKINGMYDLETKIVNADIKARKFSLKWLEYILKSGISNVQGTVDLDGKVLGKLNQLSIDADGVANDGQVKVNYLGETYYFNKQAFTVTDKRIDLSGAQLTDSQGNFGEITGGLNHKLFKDFTLDASIVGNNVIAINTTKYDNPIYYGLGKGDVTVDFIGSVDAPRMLINAVTKPGTKINIPIKESRSTSDKNFIHFIDKDEYFLTKKDSTNKTLGVKVDGISIEMNLTMTEDAIVNMIFDEYKNDIIRGVGKGNLKISMSNRGEFDMFGAYTISQGQYLFTALDIINKPFIVREGGTIRWTGDPINASLNIEADYSVRTSLSNFLPEYLTTDQLRNAAAVSTPVNLKLLLSNTLYNPKVKFDLEFPALAGELKSYTDSKLRLLRNNEADFNSQVFGLIIFNTFVPSSTISEVVTSNNFISNAGINTLSEFVSSQFSMYVTSLVNSALEDNGLISGIDFDLDLRNSSSFQGVDGQATVWPTEIEVRLKNRFRFLDERLSVNVGGNYVRQNSIGVLNNYVIPEFFIEYALTKDKQLNLKLYGKYDLDEINFSNRRQKFGLGLRYKNDFGSVRETRTEISQAIAKILNGKG